jgi:hypothetical protein
MQREKMMNKLRKLLRSSVAASLAAMLIFGTANSSLAGAVSKIDSMQRVEANSSQIYDIRFNGGELARVWIIGDGDTDLDLYVYDQRGRLVIKNENKTDNAQVYFSPQQTESYTVMVKNRGGVYNRFRLWTN